MTTQHPQRAKPAARAQVAARAPAPRAKPAPWLDRALLVAPVHYALCTSPAQYEATLRHVNLPDQDWPPFMPNEHADACVHYFTHGGTKRIALVCIQVDPTRTRTGIEVAGLLVHEAMHVWRWMRELLGEDSPATEQEAYAMQCISQELMQAYAEALSQ